MIFLGFLIVIFHIIENLMLKKTEVPIPTNKKVYKLDFF